MFYQVEVTEGVHSRFTYHTRPEECMIVSLSIQYDFMYTVKNITRIYLEEISVFQKEIYPIRPAFHAQDFLAMGVPLVPMQEALR
jgi:hypothetical protein